MSTASTVSAPLTVSRPEGATYNYAIGYLRGVIVALVVAHHAVLAYHPAAAPVPTSLLTLPRVWQAYPVVDSHRATWAGVFATVNDIFFMALMFFLSGLFVWGSLNRKGAGVYMHDRLWRLGLPFFPAAVILAPLAYYPTYLQIAGHAGFGDFLRQWAALGSWSAGPVWFLWVLLVFDWVAATLFRLSPQWGSRMGRSIGNVSCNPALFFFLLVAVTAVVYMPATLVFGPFSWASWGPFTFQESRLLLYLVYFFAGIGVGGWGLERSLLAGGGRLARRWPLWVIAAVLAFLAREMAVRAVLSHPLPQTFLEAIQSGPVMAALALFPASCAASSFAMQAIFVRFANSRIRFFDGLARNSYGIFLVHFVFVSWLGYALLGAALPALAKFLLVTAGALALSWGATILLRRIPGAARVL